MLEIVGLAAMAERPATRLSGGQQQRVALARALVAEPEVLLEVAEACLDRPAAGVAFEDFLHGEHRVGAEEDAQPDRSGAHLDDDDVQQADAARAVPLPVYLLVADGSLAPVEVGLDQAPGLAVVAGQRFGLGQDIAALAAAPARTGAARALALARAAGDLEISLRRGICSAMSNTPSAT